MWAQKIKQMIRLLRTSKTQPSPAPGKYCYVQHARPGDRQWYAIPHYHPERRPAGSQIKPPKSRPR